MPRYKVASNAPSVKTVQTGNSIPTGMIWCETSGIVPEGSLACVGQMVNISDYPQLYNYLTRNGTVTNPWGGDSGGQFRLPDFRGRFARGWSQGAGDDPDRASRSARFSGGWTGDNIGSYQSDQFGSHNHADAGHNHPEQWIAVGNGTVAAGSTYGMQYSGSYFGYANIQYNGGNETRPENAYVLFCIKT